MSTFTCAVTPPVIRYSMGRAPCQSLGTSGPFMFSSSGFASCQERGSPIIFGSDRDFSLDADSVPSQQIVIFGIPAVRVDHFRGHFAGSGVSKIRAGNGGILGIGIGFVRILAQ